MQNLDRKVQKECEGYRRVAKGEGGAGERFAVM
jgi:hypothetical protein